MAVEQSIWLALKGHIDAMAGFNYDIAWPAQPYTPDTSPYMRVAFINATPDRPMIDYGYPHERTGFLMLTLVYAAGLNVSYAFRMKEAGQVAAHFSDGSQLRYGSVCVTIPEYPHVMDGFEEDGYFAVPVRIPWRCMA